jgi:hypothetical protein
MIVATMKTLLAGTHSISPTPGGLTEERIKWVNLLSNLMKKYSVTNCRMWP